MRIPSKKFTFGFLLGFFLVLLSGLWAAHTLNDSIQAQEKDVSLIPILPKELRVESVTSALEAKRRRLLWFSKSFDGRGLAGQGFQVPWVHQALLPGYPVGAANKLGSRYFQHRFNQRIWIDRLSRQTDFGVSTFLAWLGCLELFNHYGGDVVVFGNSEANEGLVLEKLSWRPKQRVLSCAGPAKGLGSLTHLARRLAETGRRAEWAVVGYSLNAVLLPRNEELSEIERAQLVGQRGSRWSNLLELKLADSFDTLDWEHWFPFSIASYTQRAQTVEPGSKKREFSFEHGVPVSGSKKLSHREIVPYAREVQRQRRPYIKRDVCRPAVLSAQLDKLIESTLAVANRVLLYVPPTTPLNYVELMPEDVRCAKQVLQSKVSDRVHVLARPWTFYGMDYTHFQYHRGNETGLRINVNHTNFFGALRVTEKLRAHLRDLSRPRLLKENS